MTFSVFVIFFTTQLCGQTSNTPFVEQLGGVRTHYLVTSGQVELDVIDQVLIRRGKSETYWTQGGSSGSAFGNSTLRWEFMARASLASSNSSSILRSQDSYYHIKCYSIEGEVLWSTNLGQDRVLHHYEDGIHIYNFDLERLPVTPFLNAHRVHVEYVVPRRD